MIKLSSIRKVVRIYGQTDCRHRICGDCDAIVAGQRFSQLRVFEGHSSNLRSERLLVIQCPFAAWGISDAIDLHIMNGFQLTCAERSIDFVAARISNRILANAKVPNWEGIIRGVAKLDTPAVDIEVCGTEGAPPGEVYLTGNDHAIWQLAIAATKLGEIELEFVTRPS